MKRTGAGNKQIDTIPFFMSLGMGIGAVISLVFHQVMYMAIGWGIGTVIGLLLKLLVVNKNMTKRISLKQATVGICDDEG